jgi:hypothetical protein
MDTGAQRPRTTRFRGYLVASFVGLLAILAFVFLARSSRTGLSYQGKPLEDWFKQLPLAIVSTNGTVASISGTLSMNGRLLVATTNTAEAAIKGMGKAAVPFLCAKLLQPDSSFPQKVCAARVWLALWTAKCGLRLPMPHLPQLERAQAVTGLLALSPLPDEYAARLRAAGSNASPEVAAAAKYVLNGPGNTPTGEWNIQGSLNLQASMSGPSTLSGSNASVALKSRAGTNR